VQTPFAGCVDLTSLFMHEQRPNCLRIQGRGRFARAKTLSTV
jgi:hypothetical protein